MTTREQLEKKLYQCGMFENQAKDAAAKAITAIDSSENSDYRITWDRPASEYPEIMHELILEQAKPFVLKWIDVNIPEAWYRPIFEPTHE